MWTTKVAEATAQSERYRRLAEGYTRMVEGLKLIYPELAVVAEEPANRTDYGAGHQEPPRQYPLPGAPVSTEMALIEAFGTDPAFLTTRALADAALGLGWHTDSPDPERPIRKWLRRARETGRVVAVDLDGRS